MREVRVIGADGAQLGVMDTRRAIELAQSHGLDLAEVSPKASPPVCKILDYGKFKYEQKKKMRAAKKRQSTTTVKEVQFRPRTDTHDIDYKVKHIARFLSEGNKVKVSIRFRGRELAHTNIGHHLAAQIVDKVGNLGIVEAKAKMEARVLSLVFAPNPKLRRAGKPKEIKPVEPSTSTGDAP